MSADRPLSQSLKDESLESKSPKTERLQKVLARWGIASRRRSEELIQAGRVWVNGQPANLGMQINPDHDRVEVDRHLVNPQQPKTQHYLLLNKPRGVVSTCHDPQGRRTVLDCLPSALRQNTGLHPVGRLDTDSSGALLLTNDGDLTFRLTHPRHHVPKIYRVWVAGVPSERSLQQWRSGVMLDDRLTHPAEVTVLRHRSPKPPKLPQKSHRLQHSSTTDRPRSVQSQDSAHRPIKAINAINTINTTATIHASATQLEIILIEGRNRQIRRVAEILGHPVISLHRVAIGSLNLLEPTLASGAYRTLSPDELTQLRGD